MSAKKLGLWTKPGNPITEILCRDAAGSAELGGVDSKSRVSSWSKASLGGD